jgi:RNA-dependent RNA polymerase
MRKLQAVDIKALHHLVNCIVFPAKGPRPHTDEISGSDLDGDKYFVTWYRPLIPPNDNAKPMDFQSPKKRVLDRGVNVEDMIKFVAEYIKNDQLGVIANSHLVHADSEADGMALINVYHIGHRKHFPCFGRMRNAVGTASSSITL